MQIVVGGILANFQSLGEKGDSLLILHGWQRSSDEWISIAKELSNNNKVLVLDLPGFGATPRPQASWGVDEYATFVEEFLSKLEIKKPIVLGHSFGGRIGIVLASRDILKKLILVDAAAIEKKSLFVKVRVLINKILIFPFKILMPGRARKIKESFGSEDYRSAGLLRDIFVKTVNTDLMEFLPKIDVPTLVIWGEKDSVRPIDEGKMIHRGINGSKFRVVWGAGHSPHLEKPREFLEIVKEYL